MLDTRQFRRYWRVLSVVVMCIYLIKMLHSHSKTYLAATKRHLRYNTEHTSLIYFMNPPSSSSSRNGYCSNPTNSYPMMSLSKFHPKFSPFLATAVPATRLIAHSIPPDDDVSCLLALSWIISVLRAMFSRCSLSNFACRAWSFSRIAW